jgi:hypothetical protein
MEAAVMKRREFLAFGGASSLAFGARASAPEVTFVTPQQFGARAIGEGFDDGPAIQRAVDFASSNASRLTVRFPRVEAFYNVRRPVICRPGVSLVGDNARIKNLNEEGFLERSVFLPGNFHPDFTEKLDYFEVHPTGNPRVLRLASARHAVDLQPGKQVFIASLEYDFTNEFKVPEYGWLNTVVAQRGDRVHLDNGVDVEKDTYRMAILGTPARDDIPLFYHADAEIRGFDIETTGHWISDSAAYNVTISGNKVKSKTAIYGNTYQKCRWLDNVFQSRNGFSEQSHNSWNTLASGNRFTRVAVDEEPFVGFSFQEFARGITIENSDVSVGRCTGKRGPMVWFLNAAGVSVRDLRVSIESYGATTLVGFGRRDARATFRQAMNILSESSFDVGVCGRYVEANGFNSPHILNNRIEKCSFEGDRLVAEGMRFVDNISPFEIRETTWKGALTVKGTAPRIT